MACALPVPTRVPLADINNWTWPLKLLMRQESISDIFFRQFTRQVTNPYFWCESWNPFTISLLNGIISFFFFLVSRVFGYVYCFQYSPWCLKSSAEVPEGVPLGEGEWGPQWGWTTGVQIKEKPFHFSICIEFLVKFYVREVFYNWEKILKSLNYTSSSVS